MSRGLLVTSNLSSVRRVKSSQGIRRGTCGWITSFFYFFYFGLLYPLNSYGPVAHLVLCVSKCLHEAKKSAALAYAKSILKGGGVGFEYGLHTYEPVGKSRRVHFKIIKSKHPFPFEIILKNKVKFVN